MAKNNEQTNIRGWYDGLVYNRLIDPMTKASFRKYVKKNIPDNASVLDIGCGTGILLRELSSRINYGTGIDLSSKMITFARKETDNMNISHIDFIHGNVLNLSSSISRKYDYAVITQFLHEIPENLRVPVIEEARKHVSKIIICDFAAPFPKHKISSFLRFIEFMAGRDHYRNFKNWYNVGGLQGLAHMLDMNISEKKNFSPGVAMALILSQ